MTSSIDRDPMPQPGDGPDYFADLAAWNARNPIKSPSEDKQALMADLEAWWYAKADDEISRTVPKAVEYGADDLVEIGKELVAAGVRDPGTGDIGYAELGIFFYEVGKMARWRSAVRRGEPVSDDTLFDIGVYIRMAQRNRTNSGWPGLTQEQMTKTDEQHPTLFDNDTEDGMGE